MTGEPPKRRGVWYTVGRMQNRIFLFFDCALKNIADGAKRSLKGSSRTQSSSSRRCRRARARARSLFNRSRRPECRTALAVTRPPNRPTPVCALLKSYYLYYWTYYVCARQNDQSGVPSACRQNPWPVDWRAGSRGASKRATFGGLYSFPLLDTFILIIIFYYLSLSLQGRKRGKKR